MTAILRPKQSLLCDLAAAVLAANGRFAKSKAARTMSSPWSLQANQLCKIEIGLHVTCNAGVSDHDLMFSKKAEDSGMQRGEHWAEPLDSRQAARPAPQSAVRQRMANAAGNLQLLLYAAFVPHVVLVLVTYWLGTMCSHKGCWLALNVCSADDGTYALMDGNLL